MKEIFSSRDNEKVVQLLMEYQSDAVFAEEIRFQLFKYIYHFISLNAVWWTFPVTEIIASMTNVVHGH